MAIDSRLKRQSATCLIVPSLISSAFPYAVGISPTESRRQAMAWCYAGIIALEAETLKWSLNIEDNSLSMGLNF